MTDLQDQRQRWERETYQPTKARTPERKERFKTSSGIEMPPLYTPDEDEAEHLISEVGFPGEYPYTRGVQPTMYRGRLWTMRQYAGYATAAESNTRYRYLLGQGQT